MAKLIRVIRRRRVCRLPGCKCRLSIYNLLPYCHAHQHLAERPHAVAAAPA